MHTLSEHLHPPHGSPSREVSGTPLPLSRPGQVSVNRRKSTTTVGTVVPTPSVLSHPLGGLRSKPGERSSVRGCTLPTKTRFCCPRLVRRDAGMVSAQTKSSVKTALSSLAVLDRRQKRRAASNPRRETEKERSLGNGGLPRPADKATLADRLMRLIRGHMCKMSRSQKAANIAGRRERGHWTSLSETGTGSAGGGAVHFLLGQPRTQSIREGDRQGHMVMHQKQLGFREEPETILTQTEKKDILADSGKVNCWHTFFSL